VIVTLLLAGAGAVVWTVALRRFLRAAPVAAATPGSVSIVVPARDEAHNLPALLASLARLEPPPAQVIVVDDHSTDDTGAIARAAGAIVLTPPPLPPGWLGKSWACHWGAGAATGEWILFTDADTTHAPDSLARALGHQAATGAELVTVVPTHTLVDRWERLQGAFQLLLLIASGRHYAIGQYLLFRRAAYLAIGGHVAVRDRLGEDLALCAAIRANGGRAEVVHDRGLLGVRMYPEGARAFLRGWRRSFRDGLSTAGWRGVVAIGLVFAWLGGLPLALAAAVVTGAWPAAAVLGGAWLISSVEVARRQRRLGDFPAWTAALAPVSLVAFAAVTAAALFDQLRGVPVMWRGRAISMSRRPDAKSAVDPVPVGGELRRARARADRPVAGRRGRRGRPRR